MDNCLFCGLSLVNGYLTLPWEDGNNAFAYVTCPHCGYQTILDGYGEDDD
jgi:DNA-directed RNA polymerase subunit RPC12/RpoP